MMEIWTQWCESKWREELWEYDSGLKVNLKGEVYQIDTILPNEGCVIHGSDPCQGA